MKRETSKQIDDLATRVIGAAIEVHRELGRSAEHCSARTRFTCGAMLRAPAKTSPLLKDGVQRVVYGSQSNSRKLGVLGVLAVIILAVVCLF